MITLVIVHNLKEIAKATFPRCVYCGMHVPSDYNANEGLLFLFASFFFLSVSQEKANSKTVQLQKASQRPRVVLNRNVGLKITH